ncbi:pheromone alpha factor receptor [Fusarium piperis]|uniref:Pheromone alpha factor receptor n=1 Tax=Fusarium piperis TaxID=1435070 RepID=A0A9W8WHV4_9HYPO|nr:pheromone alpha factor receptor [Fusarium piperis]
MGGFDPYTQNVTFFLADGKTEVQIPMPVLDGFRREITSICINYGTQLGACVIMLITLLIMTPAAKLRRPSNILHILGLVVCAIRMLLLSLYWPSIFTDFYNFWARDYSHIPQSEFAKSVAGNVMSLLLVIIIELALMNQAWTMVSLWPDVWKYAIVAFSGFVTLLTIASRIAFTVHQNKANLSLTPASMNEWLIRWMVVMNVVSISWFCAIFNIKLVWHIISNRSVLPSSYKALTPMEVLVMTNGILMMVPVVFAGLEWGHWLNFESASLTLTSVAIILPMGTLAAQRMASSGSNFSCSSGGDSSVRYNPSFSGRGAGSMAPLKAASFSTHHTATTVERTPAVFARCEAGMSSRDRMNPIDLELGKYDSDSHVRVDRNLTQHEERV